MRRTSTLPVRQRGAALLLAMLAVIVAMSTLLLTKLSRDDLRILQLERSQAMLAEARTALIDFALVNPDVNPGQAHSLPCPDIDSSGGFAEGESHTSACGAAGVSAMGRLPWKTLGVPALKDAASACLWYVVSGSYKQAGVDTAELINVDTNGQLQLFDIESAAISEGLAAEDRPVAMVIAAMQPLSVQIRSGSSAGSFCVPGANPANYLDTEAISGISNAALSGTADTLDLLAVVAGSSDDHNDRIMTISRADIERRVSNRANYLSDMRSLGLAAAACIADYGANNPGGADDKRLPWPAPVALADYRPDVSYNDADSGLYSGRLADIADDSNTSTGNSIARVLSDCNSTAVPAWTPVQLARWQHWKDHFFYAVAGSHSPVAAAPTICASCLTVNGSGQYAAVLLFANSRLSSGGQLRNVPPIDADTKSNSANYLEGLNAANVPGTAAASDYLSGPLSGTFNDLLFCIDDQLVVSEC